jgi:hypothetical protein
MNEGLNPVCKLCPLKKSEHEGLHHPFVGPDEDPGAAFKKPEKKRPNEAPRLIITPAPDITLRQLLLRKGLITPGELEAIERELTLGVIGIQTSGQAADVRSEPPANG